MALQIFIVVRAGPGDEHDLPRPQVLQHGLHCGGYAARTQDQGLFAPELRPGGAEHIGKSVVVGIVAQKSSVLLPDDGVHAADAPGLVGEGLTEGDHRLFIGDGHVQPLKSPVGEEVSQLLRLLFHQPVVISGQLLVNGGRKAVAQLLPQQAIFQLAHISR